MKIRAKVAKMSSLLLGAMSVTTLAFALTANQTVSATVPGTNYLISVNNTGNGQGGDQHTYASGASGSTAVSGDGRFIAFSSDASNLVSGDTNGYPDIFVRDLKNNITTRISISTAGIQADLGAADRTVAMSTNGRYIAFASTSTNLISGRTIPSTQPQIYIRDTITNTTSLATQTGAGTIGNSTGSIGKWAKVGSISSDGRFLAFSSPYDNLGVTITAAGIHAYLLDRDTGVFQTLDNPTYGVTAVGHLSMSCDGSLLALSSTTPMTSDDTDSFLDVFLVDLRNGKKVTNITVASAIASDTSGISCNGDYIALESSDNVFDSSAGIPTANTIVHSYLYDRANNSFELLDKSTGGVVGNNDVAYTGTVVDNYGNAVFVSKATNLMTTSYSTTSYQVWLRSRGASTTELLSKNSSGTIGNVGSFNSTAISSNGKIATYASNSTNLISSDTNGKIDAYASLTGL